MTASSEPRTPLAPSTEARGWKPQVSESPAAFRTARRHTQRAVQSRRRRVPLNEGRGVNPGDTKPMREGVVNGWHAQRRPRREPRRHWPGCACWTRRCASLNEGRGVNPGDTRARVRSGAGGVDAQRRPRRESRRHAMSSTQYDAGQSAQRRPRREPRRHALGSSSRRPPRPSLNEGRGVNPGDTDPDGHELIKGMVAQRRPRREPRRHTAAPGAGAARRSALNEGRGVNPGDTLSDRVAADLPVRRSTKAEA